MENKLSPKVGFNKDAKQVLLGLLKRTIELIRVDVITEPLDVGIVAAHLRDFCCYLDGTWEHDEEGFFGGLDGSTQWGLLNENLQETSDLKWHKILSDHLSTDKWPKNPGVEAALRELDGNGVEKTEPEPTISMESKTA